MRRSYLCDLPARPFLNIVKMAHSFLFFVFFAMGTPDFADGVEQLDVL